MKQYITPDVELLALYAKDVMMASDNVSKKDEFTTSDLNIADIETV